MTQQYITGTDDNAVWYQACFVKKITFPIRKITNTAATRAALFDSNLHHHLSAGAVLL